MNNIQGIGIQYNNNIGYNGVFKYGVNYNQMVSFAQLMKSAGSDLYLDARKANGISQGINSPLVNPWVDLTKNGNNATFQNIAGTTSDGWVNVLLPNGKTMPFLKLDGLNTVGIIPNNPSVDIVGLDEFEIDMVILTPSTFNNSIILFKGLDSSTTNTQLYVYFDATGYVIIRLENTSVVIIPTGGIVSNNLYNISIKRQNGRLISKVNAVESYNQPNTTTLNSQPNFRLGARSNNIGGTAHTAFSNVYIGVLSISKNPDFTKLSSAWNKIVSDYI